MTLRYIDRRAARRVYIFIVVLICGTGLLFSGHDLASVVLTLLGVGLAGATIARWVVDGAPLPALSSVVEPGGQA